jgi:N-carbamoylputrescine amidase
MKVALIQHACNADLKINRQRTEQGILTAAQQGVELVLLQELHASLYFCQTEDVNQFDLAKPIPSEETDWLSNLAKQLKIVIVSSLFEKRAAGLYHNTAVVFEKDGTIAGKYRKMHIPDDPNFYEKFYFTIGDLGFQPIQTSVGKLGVLVCWDQWYPEAARLMALAGAEILLYPTAIGWNPDDEQSEKNRQKEAWITIQRSHAIANGIPVLSCNRCGLETDPSEHTSGIQFWGNSFIVGAQGEFLAQSSVENPEVLIAEIDKKRSEEVRRIWPFLRDRRIDYYQDLTKRYLD